MNKTLLSLLLLCIGLSLYAVPAYRGWQTKTQPDGTTVQVRLNGDETYHFYTDMHNNIVRPDSNGYWQVIAQHPSAETIRARRMASHRTNPRRVGRINLAPRGLFILVNFSDTHYQPGNTQAQMDSMMNAVNYTYDKAVGSARRYFTDQSAGHYTPVFDVVGPVTLSKHAAYYGANDEDGNDLYPGDMVVEACRLAKTQYNIDFTRYDNDHDGEIDFVYIIYAGKGEADGGAETTIWPHNWNLSAARYYHNCTYSLDECKIDGLLIENYACSGELDGKTGNRNGIGTLCHEFSHVLGLPDFYDTAYGSNYNNARTPGKWDIMDSGSYNGDGHCPPNYSAFEKYFLGWTTPCHLGNDGQSLTLHCAGTDKYQAYQLNTVDTLQPAHTEGINFYIENRQKTGWDKYLPGHGMLVWYVNYDQEIWNANKPNNTPSYPQYTIESATGYRTGIGSARDPFPGTSYVTSCTLIAGKPLRDITEDNGIISLTYKDIFLGYTVRWVVEGEVVESRMYPQAGDPLQLPETEITPCEGMRLVGWTTQSDFHDPFTMPADFFLTADGIAVTQHITYYAVFEAIETPTEE